MPPKRRIVPALVGGGNSNVNSGAFAGKLAPRKPPSTILGRSKTLGEQRYDATIAHMEKVIKSGKFGYDRYKKKKTKKLQGIEQDMRGRKGLKRFGVVENEQGKKTLKRLHADDKKESKRFCF